MTNGYQGARAQDRWAVGLSYFFSSAVDVAATYTNVQYLPGSFSRFTDNELFNTAGAFVHWKPGVSLDLTAGYSFTWATKANGIDQAATYHQIVASEYYSLSKRTALYALQAFQRARGRTLASPNFSSSGLDNQTIAATASIGDGFQSSPSSSGSMTAAIVGIIHRF
ncbi:putative porin [Paraburkholderia youngii]